MVTVFRVDLDSGKTRIVWTGNEESRHFLVDASGTVVAGEDVNEAADTAGIWTRGTGATQIWLSPLKSKETIALQGFGRTPGTVLVETDDDEHTRFRELALGGKTLSEPIAALEDSDPVVEPQLGRTIGAVHEGTADMRYTFFAASDAKLWSQVAKAFPNAVLQLEAWSGDRSKIVLRVEGQAPGAAFYLLDVTAAHARWLADEYADIAAADLGAKTAFHYAAADGTDIPHT